MLLLFRYVAVAVEVVTVDAAIGIFLVFDMVDDVYLPNCCYCCGGDC